MYALGIGVPKDTAQAIRLLKAHCQLDITTTADGRTQVQVGNPANMLACLQLARQYLRGEGVPRDDHKPLAILSVLCKQSHDSPACFSLGTMEKRYQRYQSAAQLYRQACEAGFLMACDALGELHEQGQGVPQDIARAMQLYEKACTDDMALGCLHLGWMYIRQQPIKDVSRGLKLLESACHHPNTPVGSACFQLASLHASGEYVAKDSAKAASYLRRSIKVLQIGCYVGNYMEDCLNLGIISREGIVGSADPKAAKHFFQWACSLGHRGACGMAGDPSYK